MKLSDIFKEGSEARKRFAQFYAVFAIATIVLGSCAAGARHAGIGLSIRSLLFHPPNTLPATVPSRRRCD